MKHVKAIFRKESWGYLNSSVALIFVGTFLALSLFFFFWVDKFFERNIADLRPLFNRLPLLLIFLVSALTMRSWAEERSQGTLELLLTWPVRLSRLVLGKFFGVLSLVALALALTFPLVITAAYFGHLDWGPVIGGYLGALLVASAYIAIGLFVSALTANQIAALFVTTLLCGAFYVVGTDKLVEFFPNRVSEVLLALGTGSRFDSIARGVIDIRDLVYYASITLFFGLLNVFALLRQSWSRIPQKGPQAHHRQWMMAVALVFVNLLALNIWVYRIYSLRLDLTARREYSISKTTKSMIAGLREPLIIKFYASDTHPLLKPLIPQTRDLIKEYQVMSNGRIHAEFVDPTTNVDAEKEANQEYGIRPVPFRVSGRNEAKIVNSYFNIVMVYGDQHLVLNFDDLIEVSFSGGENLEVKLRNLEYDLTRAIKKVVYGFQGMEELFASLPEPIKVQVVYTPKTLVKALAEVPGRIRKVYDDMARRSGGKFSYEMIDLDEPNASLSKKELGEKYGIKPFQTMTGEIFYLHTLVHSGKQTRVVFPTGELTEKDIQAAIESELKHDSSGFLKTVGLWIPPPAAPQYGNPMNRGQSQEDSFRLLTQILEVDYKVKDVDLSTGIVPKDVDVLVVVKPKRFREKEFFAIDQFLMEGGTVVVASGNFEMEVPPAGGIGVKDVQGGIQELLNFYGVDLQKDLVMDLQNGPFPLMIPRDLGNGVTIPELRLIRYPFFVDIRHDGMVEDHPAFSGLESVILAWPSSLNLNEEKVKSGQIQALMHSSAKSWKRPNSEIQPNFKMYPEIGFALPDKLQSNILAASVKGPLESYFKDKNSPITAEKLAAAEEAKKASVKNKQDEDAKTLSKIDKDMDQVIRKSPESARLVVIGSGEFLSDRLLNMWQQSGQEIYRSNLVLAQNLIDWSIEDLDLLSIRSRGTFARTLRLGDPRAADFWTLGNYVVGLLSLSGLVIFVRLRRRHVKPLQFNVAHKQGGGRPSALKEEKAA